MTDREQIRRYAEEVLQSTWYWELPARIDALLKQSAHQARGHDSEERKP